MNKLQVQEINIVANFFNNKGTLNVYRYKNRISLRLILSSKDKNKIKEIYQILGTGKFIGPYKNSSGGEYWRFGLNKKSEILKFIDYVYPIISKSRQEYINKCFARTTNWAETKCKELSVCLNCNCNTTFIGRPQQKYCSNKCYQKSRSISIITIPCKYCGKLVARTKSEINWSKKISKHGNIFCNASCNAKYNNNLK